MKRLSLVSACLIGSVIAGGLGLAAGIAWNTWTVACTCSVVVPTTAVYLAGLRDHSQLIKIATFALLGWSLSSTLGPSVSQGPQSRARRIAADPLKGHGWLISCAAMSCLIASVGVWYAPGGESTEP